MKKGESRSAEANQLYLLIRPLTILVPDADDLGTFLGLGVVDGLSDFDLKSRSEDERKYGEVKAVCGTYQRLKDRIGSQVEDYFEVLFTLQNRLDPFLKGIPNLSLPSREIVDSTSFNGSRLLYEILETLQFRGGEPINRLRVYGISLQNRVMDRGCINGNRNSLLRDYEDLSYCFVRKKGDRRE